ncbi:L,D-transpeptidase family protein [Flavobacterium sp. MAH-1]|uniref:L,D-transpeptidase family protein n=1 Tax=Flavobacterium agri TaxID=2743471 RepID=A0A7Y9C5G5_9FLAO|nr:L,D-transpeptidase family protein [Flavobacterium agri]NUY80956.1 L,D-transpeptidase family protein [Flavobacterium agri]NYA70980.1 L,D-transpeptidase family protein [Flavobacterium agri]
MILVTIGSLLAYYFWPSKKLPKEARIDFIEVWKSKRKMDVFGNGKLLKTYRIALGKNPGGRKEFEGDNRTPEGSYLINARNPNSKFYKNLGISYPNESDLRHAEALGKPAGGDIKIHGLRNGRGYRGKFHRLKNWTAGCIAVTNSEMDELFESVTDNARITIHP